VAAKTLIGDIIDGFFILCQISKTCIEV